MSARTIEGVGVSESVRVSAKRSGRGSRWTAILAVASIASMGLAMAAVPETSAQPRLDARGVASAVQRLYDQRDVFSADFYQTYFNKLYNTYQRSNGRVFFKKPGKMRWDYAGSNGKVIVSDGQRIQYY